MMTDHSNMQTDRRVRFWSTQSNAYGHYDICNNQECGIPGLKIISHEQSATISTKDYVVGLALNILLTDAKKDDKACGYLPGTRGGHWSDSFTGATTGSKLRQIPTTYSIRETLSLVKANIQQDCQKLVYPYGVAEKIKTDVSYDGVNDIHVLLRIFGRSEKVYSVGLLGTRQTNSWVWNTTNDM